MKPMNIETVVGSHRQPPLTPRDQEGPNEAMQTEPFKNGAYEDRQAHTDRAIGSFIRQRWQLLIPIALALGVLPVMRWEFAALVTKVDANHKVVVQRLDTLTSEVADIKAVTIDLQRSVLNLSLEMTRFMHPANAGAPGTPPAPPHKPERKRVGVKTPAKQGWFF